MKITTREELEAHIKDYENKDVPLFCAYTHNNYVQVQDESIMNGNIITIETSEYTETLHLYVNFISHASLCDRHVGYEQNYNDNWWFTTEQEAKDYIKSKADNNKKWNELNV